MKTATIPSLRVDPVLRQAAQDVLLEGESLSSFVEQSIQANIDRRRAQSEFIARGLASRDQSRQADDHVGCGEVVKILQQRLARAKLKASKSR